MKVKREGEYAREVLMSVEMREIERARQNARTEKGEVG